MLRSIFLSFFLFLVDLTLATDPGSFGLVYTIKDMFRMDLGCPELIYDVLTYETELSCGLHLTWCYKVTIWEWDKFSADDRLMSHPTICTNKADGKIKLRFVSKDFNHDERDDIEPYAIIHHNCSQDRQTKEIRYQLPAIDYRNQKSFYRHYFGLVVTNQGSESEWETASLVNYDDSKILHQSKFQNIHHFGKRKEFVHVEPATENNFSNSSFLMESFKILSKMNFSELISNTKFDKVTDVRNETKLSGIFSNMFDIFALAGNKTITESSEIDKSDDSESNKSSNHWFSHIKGISSIFSKIMDTKNLSANSTTTTTPQTPMTEKRRTDVFKARKNPWKVKKNEKAPEDEKNYFQNKPESQLNVVH